MREPRVERAGEVRDDRQRRGHGAKAQPPGQALVHFLEIAPQNLGFREDAPSVIEHQPALAGQAMELVAAFDDRRAEIRLKLAYRRRKRRLRDIAGERRAAKMPLSRERDEIFELAKHHRRMPAAKRRFLRDRWGAAGRAVHLRSAPATGDRTGYLRNANVTHLAQKQQRALL